MPPPELEPESRDTECQRASHSAIKRLSKKSHPPKTEVFVGHFRRATLGEVISVQNSIMSAQKKKKEKALCCRRCSAVASNARLKSDHIRELLNLLVTERVKLFVGGSVGRLFYKGWLCLCCSISALYGDDKRTVHSCLRVPFTPKAPRNGSWQNSILLNSSPLSSGAFCCLIIPSERPDREKRYPTNSRDTGQPGEREKAFFWRSSQ
ncbi:hypothetical protein CEXT_224331 [Caerostris extrusa]|uniref:Uncharacterized protein n=1 Tax=Caerostris extrusa TaxID=172846 RepID=A0AAV4XE50_CAEEX|nr:hypothetical protein CEXT_224331 [Caerostris extrusa]